MRWTWQLGVVLALLVVSAAAYVFWPESDDPHSVCVRQAKEHKEVAFTGPVSDEQIEDFCRGLLSGEPVLRR